jgi:hypothetical protein
VNESGAPPRRTEAPRSPLGIVRALGASRSYPGSVAVRLRLRPQPHPPHDRRLPRTAMPGPEAGRRQLGTHPPVAEPVAPQGRSVQTPPDHSSLVRRPSPCVSGGGGSRPMVSGAVDAHVLRPARRRTRRQPGGAEDRLPAPGPAPSPRPARRGPRREGAGGQPGHVAAQRRLLRAEGPRAAAPLRPLAPQRRRRRRGPAGAGPRPRHQRPTRHPAPTRRRPHGTSSRSTTPCSITSATTP